MAVLLLSGFLPFILSFWPPLGFWRHRRSLVCSIGIILAIYGSWDVFAAWRGHWHFNPEGVWGFRLAGLPLEEVLFFIVIPFCAIFTWEAINYLKGRIIK